MATSHLGRRTLSREARWTPRWSPDGKKVTYVSNETEQFEIWTVDVETLERKNLTPDSDANFVPHWSPDGSRILYSVWRGDPVEGSYDLATVFPDGTGQRDLVASPVDEMSSRWSPDGHQILFWSWRTGNPEIFLVKAVGSGMKQLTDNLAWDMFPSWSPDGKRIAFDSDRMGNFDIWVMELD
jgi:TolB protein